MPASDQVRQSLKQRRPMVDKVLRFGLSMALGGNVPAEALQIKNEEKLMDLMSDVGEQVANQAGAKHHTIKKTIANFGMPAAPEGSSTETAQLAPSDAQGAGTPTPTEIKGALGPDAQAEGSGTPASTPTGSDGGNNAGAQSNDGSGEDSQSPDEEDGSLKHCPHDGQILNPDGTCPAGDHSSLGGTPGNKPGEPGAGQPPASQPGVGANPNAARGPGDASNQGQQGQAQSPQTPPPIPPHVIIASQQTAAAQKKVKEIDQQINQANQQIKRLEKKLKSIKNHNKAIYAFMAFGCLTIVFSLLTGPLGGAYRWYLWYKESK